MGTRVVLEDTFTGRTLCIIFICQPLLAHFAVCSGCRCGHIGRVQFSHLVFRQKNGSPCYCIVNPDIIRPTKFYHLLLLLRPGLRLFRQCAMMNVVMSDCQCLHNGRFQSSHLVSLQMPAQSSHLVSHRMHAQSGHLAFRQMKGSP